MAQKSKFHVTPTGQSRTCSAKTNESCKYSKETGVVQPHFETREDAQAYAEKMLADKVGETKVKKAGKGVALDLDVLTQNRSMDEQEAYVASLDNDGIEYLVKNFKKLDSAGRIRAWGLHKNPRITEAQLLKLAKNTTYTTRNKENIRVLDDRAFTDLIIHKADRPALRKNIVSFNPHYSMDEKYEITKQYPDDKYIKGVVKMFTDAGYDMSHLAVERDVANNENTMATIDGNSIKVDMNAVNPHEQGTLEHKAFDTVRNVLLSAAAKDGFLENYKGKPMYKRILESGSYASAKTSKAQVNFALNIAQERLRQTSTEPFAKRIYNQDLYEASLYLGKGTKQGIIKATVMIDNVVKKADLSEKRQMEMIQRKKTAESLNRQKHGKATLETVHDFIDYESDGDFQDFMDRYNKKTRAPGITSYGYIHERTLTNEGDSIRFTTATEKSARFTFNGNKFHAQKTNGRWSIKRDYSR